VEKPAVKFANNLATERLGLDGGSLIWMSIAMFSPNTYLTSPEFQATNEVRLRSTSIEIFFRP
jgi:hypothetical protein